MGLSVVFFTEETSFSSVPSMRNVHLGSELPSPYKTALSLMARCLPRPNPTHFVRRLVRPVLVLLAKQGQSPGSPGCSTTQGSVLIPHGCSRTCARRRRRPRAGTTSCTRCFSTALSCAGITSSGRVDGVMARVDGVMMRRWRAGARLAHSSMASSGERITHTEKGRRTKAGRFSSPMKSAEDTVSTSSHVTSRMGPLMPKSIGFSSSE